ncbi:MAG: hypothetical protein EXR51_00305 [Dehalococcoidia bacterium]|nr:hypothetical protein [Dehalococcoidia bacterium]
MEFEQRRRAFGGQVGRSHHCDAGRPVQPAAGHGPRIRRRRERWRAHRGRPSQRRSLGPHHSPHDVRARHRPDQHLLHRRADPVQLRRRHARPTEGYQRRFSARPARPSIDCLGTGSGRYR